MPKIYYDGEIKIVDHGKWQEWIWPCGFKHSEGEIPEYKQHQFYQSYNPQAGRITHRSSLDSLIQMAQKQGHQEK